MITAPMIAPTNMPNGQRSHETRPRPRASKTPAAAVILRSGMSSTQPAM